MIGLPYKPEVNDCLQCVRNYFEPRGISIRDYAFPSDFWDYGDSMYERLFFREGFYEVDREAWTPQASDVMLVRGAQGVSFPTHIGVLLEDGKVLHHYTGRFSEVTDFKGIWRTPVRILRHESQRPKDASQLPTKNIDLLELMPAHVRAKFDRPTSNQV